MFQKSLNMATKRDKNKKYIIPFLQVKTIADIYTLYVLNAGIPAEDFWNKDIHFLDLVYIDKLAWNNYIKNPKER